MQKERDEERVVKQKGIKTWRFYYQKKKKKREREKACSEQNTKSVAELPLHKEILGVTTELISSQGKPGDGIAPAEMLLV